MHVRLPTHKSVQRQFQLYAVIDRGTLLDKLPCYIGLATSALSTWRWPVKKE